MTKIFQYAMILTGAAGLLLGQATTNPGTFRPPEFSLGTYPALNFTAGVINNGGHTVSIAAGSVNVSTATSCATPLTTTCNYVYSNATGTVAVTTTLATAMAANNTLLAMVETNGGGTAITSIVPAWQSGALWNSAGGPLNNFTSAPVPSTAGGVALGSAALPFSSLFLGNAATNNFQLTGTAAQGTVLTIPDPGAATATFLYTNSTTAQNLLTGSFKIADSSTPTKAIAFQSSGATAATTLTLADTVTSNRTVTFPDPGGAANVAYANQGSAAQTLLGTTFDTAGTSNVFKSNGTTASAVRATVGVQAVESATNVTTTNLTAIGSGITLAAGAINTANKVLKIHMEGIYTNTVASTIQAEVAFCTVSGCGSGTVVEPAGCNVTSENQANTLTNGGFTMDCTLVTSTTGNAGTLIASGTFCPDLGTAVAKPLSCYKDASVAATAPIDLTVQEFLQPRIKFATNTNTNDTATVQTFTAEIIN